MPQNPSAAPHHRAIGPHPLTRQACLCLDHYGVFGRNGAPARYPLRRYLEQLRQRWHSRPRRRAPAASRAVSGGLCAWAWPQLGRGPAAMLEELTTAPICPLHQTPAPTSSARPVQAAGPNLHSSGRSGDIPAVPQRLLRHMRHQHVDAQLRTGGRVHGLFAGAGCCCGRQEPINDPARHQDR